MALSIGALDGHGLSSKLKVHHDCLPKTQNDAEPLIFAPSYY